MLEKLIKDLILEKQEDLSCSFGDTVEGKKLYEFMKEHLASEDIMEIDPMIGDIVNAQEEQWFRFGFFAALQLRREMDAAEFIGNGGSIAEKAEEVKL